MDLYAYPVQLVQPLTSVFLVLRHSRDVIKVGALRMWDCGPGVGCPVRDRFFRECQLRAFSGHEVRV